MRRTSFNDLMDKIEVTATIPEMPSPIDKTPPAIADEMNKKRIDARRIQWLEWQDNVVLGLEAIRKQLVLSNKLQKAMLKRMLLENVKGETFESIITLQPSKAVFQFSFLAEDNINEQTNPGTMDIPFCPVKTLILENQNDTQTLNYYVNPRYTNLMRVNLTLSPNQITRHESNPPNIARINLLNKGASNLTVKIWAIV